MPTMVINKQYSDPIPPTTEQLDAAFEPIAVFFNVTGLGADNLEAGSITSGELADLAITETKLGGSAVSTDKFAASSVTLQKLTASIRAQAEPTGIVDAWCTDTAPTGWLLCDGIAVSRVTYSSLFAVVGTRFGNGDGTSTFNVPDLNGRFLRGVDGSAGRDPQSASRTAMSTGGAVGNNVGSIQLDDWKWSEAQVAATALFGGAGGVTGPINFGDTTTSVTSTHAGVSPVSIHSSGSTAGLETRPTNANITYIIKA